MDDIQKVFNEVKLWALDIVRYNSPVRTGKLRDSFKLVEYDDGFGIRTTIPYMQFTEEKWTYNSRWGKTLVNYNEGWFRSVAILIAEELSRRIGGDIVVIY